MAAPAAPIAASPPDLHAQRPSTGHITHAAFWAVTRRMVLMAIAAHTAFLVLFAALGAEVLATFNIVSIALFIVVYTLLQQRINRLALLLTWAELLTHATAASLWSGWDSGFHYYLLLLVPVVMVGGSRLRLPLLVALFAFYLGLFALCHYVGPFVQLSQSVQWFLQAFNTAVLFGIAGHAIGYYYRHLRASERKLMELATRDPLTGLFNRRHVVTCVSQWTAASQQKPTVTVLLADVDHFKKINDTYGHAAGDRLLTQLGRRLAELTRTKDIVGRWGGEEFLLLLPETGPHEAMSLAERIRVTCGADTVHHGDETLRITLSVGATAWTPDEPFDCAVARADRALYKSKTQGRNRVTWA